MIRYLEFINVECKDIVYSNYQDRKIYSISYIYDIFKLINAVSQFVETGNGKLLRFVYNFEENQEINELIKVICEFSEAIQLCNIRTLDDKIETLSRAIQTLEKTKSDKNNLNVVMFYELLDVIKKKFYLNDQNYKFTYPKLIKWCLENGLLQQALTFYVEKMPIAYFTENRIQEIEYENKIARPGSVEKVDMFYTGLYDSIKAENDTVELNIKAFQEIIKRIITEESKGTLKEIISKEEKSDHNVEIKNAIKELQGIMTYYLAVKYMRNNINHASDKSANEDELRLKKYLKNKNIDVDITAKNLSKVLLAGLKITHSELFG